MTASFEEREWIDARTDRVPITNDWVLISIRLKRGSRTVDKGFYEPELGAWWNVTGGEIEAWMPMPEPYGQEDTFLQIGGEA